MQNFTPLVHIPSIDPQLYLKIEYENPVAAMKFRAIPPFFEELAAAGTVKPGDTIVMRSAGSAAVAMAWVANKLDCRPVAVLPPSAPPQIVRMLYWLGAQVHSVKPDAAKQLMAEYAEQINTYIFAQAAASRLIDFYEAAGTEIVQQCADVAAITVGMGTGLSAMGLVAAAADAGLGKIVYGMEPAEAPIASGGVWAPHNIPGLAPPIPRPCLDTDLLAGIVNVPSQTAWDTAQTVARECGYLLGPSSGGTVAAALELRKQGLSGPIVAVAACGITEYLSSNHEP